MNSKHLWKNIGKQGNSSVQSSIDQNKHKKGFEINFQDQIPTPTIANHQRVLKHFDSIPQNYYLSEQSGHQRTPMILTTLDIDGNKYEEEEVLQAISLQSQKQKVVNLNYILGSFKEIEINNKPNMNKEEIQVIQEQQFKNTCENKKNNYRMIKISDKMHSLKKSYIEYQCFLSQTINSMKLSILEARNKIEQVISQQSRSLKAANQQKIQSDNEVIYKKQIDNLKQSLKKQRNKSVLYKLQLQSEIKQMKTTNEAKEEQKKKQLQLQIMKIQQSYNSKVKKLEQEIFQNKAERDNVLVKINKYKEDLLIFGNNFERITQQNNTLRKNIKQLRDKLQDQQALVRKTESKIALQKQKLENQTTHHNKQITRLKQQCSRLCGLLKQSESQLKQCDQMFTSIMKKNKDLEQQTTKLNSKLRDIDLLYYKKLQGFDKMLLQIESSLQDINKNHQHKKQQFASQLQKYQKQRQQLSFKQMQLKSREYQIEGLKKELQQQFYILEKKEEDMKAEYRTAIQIQNATKDKWYQRYYSFFPQKQEKRYKMISPTRDTSNIPNTARYQTRNEFMHSAVRQTISPPKQLCRAKSQKNFTVYTCRQGMQRQKSKFLQIQKPQPFKDYNIASRIDSLRKQLTKQLNQMTQH